MSVDIGLKLLLGVMFAATLWFIVRMDVLKQERLLKELELSSAKNLEAFEQLITNRLDGFAGQLSAASQKLAKLQERADLGRLR